jgi:Helix-turn-helix domain
MPKPKLPKVSTRDPLDNPYLADKLQKLQAVHERTEKLADEQYQKILEAQGKRPERARVTPKNRGPRTEQEKRKRYGPAPKTGGEDLLSVEEVADKLEVTERTVWNLIGSKRLAPTPIKGRTWISQVDLARYRIMFEESHVQHAFSRYPSESAAGFHKPVAFGPWGETLRELQERELKINLEDWWEFAVRSRSIPNKSTYDKLRQKIRNRMGPDAPEFFTVRFKIDQSSLARTLSEIVSKVKPPKLPLLDEQQLQIAFGGPDEVEVELIAATHRLSGRRGELVERRIDKDQLWRDLRRQALDQPKAKSKPSK